jgi:hypothetical protein
MYLGQQGTSDWPNANKYVMNYLSSLQLEGLTQKQIHSFGIIPKVNLTNLKIVSGKRKQLKDFYLYQYKQSQTSHSRVCNSFGHGRFNKSNLQKAVTVFQYDQISPVLSQQFKPKYA